MSENMKFQSLLLLNILGNLCYTMQCLIKKTQNTIQQLNGTVLKLQCFHTRLFPSCFLFAKLTISCCTIPCCIIIPACPCSPGISTLNLRLSTPCRSSRGTRDRRMARARRESFLPWAITEASGAHLKKGGGADMNSSDGGGYASDSNKKKGISYTDLASHRILA